MQQVTLKKTWINKEGNEQIETSILVNGRTGEHCQPIRPQMNSKKKQNSSKTSCQCSIF